MIYVPSRMGQLNRRALLRQLQKLGVASRADLAKALGMSQPTAGKIVDELLEMDVLEEVAAAPAEFNDHNGAGEAATPLGRPGRQLRLNQSRAKFLGIHLGLNLTMLSGLTLEAADVDHWPMTFDLKGAEANPAKEWEKKLRQAAKTLDEHFIGVVLSVPGVVDEAAGRVLYSPNLHWTEKMDLGAVVRRIWNVPALLVQEERALALGHHLCDPECEDFLLVDFGEGVGGAVIVEGKPFSNPLPISGELGHTPVPGNGRRCGCGAVGCMETLVSVRGLMETFATAVPEAERSWSGLSDYISQNGVKSWLTQSLDPAGAAIAGALNVLGLRRVVVTGSLTELPATVMDYLSHAVQDGAMWARFGQVECISAPRRRNAGMVAVGIDRLIVPDGKELHRLAVKKAPRPALSAKRSEAPPMIMN